MMEEGGPQGIDLRAILDNASEGIVALDLEGTIIYTNPRVYGLIGEKGSIIGLKFTDLRFLEDENLAGLLKLFTRTITTGSKSSVDIRTTFKGTRKERWARFNANIYKDKSGRTAGIIVSISDITPQKEYENAVKESEEKYRAAVEQSAENIYIYDVKTKQIVESNHALQRLLGYSAEEMKGMKASDFIAHTDSNIDEKVHEVVEKGSAIVGDRKYRRKDGALVDVEVSASRLTSGSEVLLCVVSRDVTERKRAREQLLEEKNRAEFYLDLLAHDIGNLHQGIMTGVGLMKLSKGNREREDKAINIVENLVNRSVRLVNNVLTLSKIRSAPLKLEVIDLRTMMEKSVTSTRESFSERKVDVSFDLRVERPFIMAEPLLEEAFFNLLHNAVKFQKMDPAIIEISLDRTVGERLVVCISDHGPGIHPDDREGLFDRFKDSSKHKHTGVGLSIAKALVERYGGTIRVEDRLPGGHEGGTRFVMEFYPFS